MPLASGHEISHVPNLLFDDLVRRRRDHRMGSTATLWGGLTRRRIDRLFRRFSVKVVVVCLRGVTGRVDDAVPMIRWCIERVEFQWKAAGVDDVVVRPGRDEYMPQSGRCAAATCDLDNRFSLVMGEVWDDDTCPLS